MVFTDIKIRPFTGNNFKEFIPCIARLKVENYREYPYLYEANLEEEKKRLKEYAEHPDSIAVLVFDGSTVVGASIGIPFIHEKKHLQKPFLEKNIDPASIFFLDLSFLLKKYRGRGIAHHFFDLREEHAKKLRGMQHTCFFCVSRAEDSSVKVPDDYLPLHNFWRKRGYIQHLDILHNVEWADIGHEGLKEKNLFCWMKEI